MLPSVVSAMSGRKLELIPSTEVDQEQKMAIKRIWRGWTSPENADAYRAVLKNHVRPGIEAKNIRGYQSLELLSRDLENEVEFMTIMTFDSLKNIMELQGEDYEQAYVPDPAKAVLLRWDPVCLHYETNE